MSSILDALNKLEEEKAQARRDAEGGPIDPEVAARELLGEAIAQPVMNLQLTPSRIAAMAAAGVTAVLMVAAIVSYLVVRGVVRDNPPAPQTVAAIPAQMPPPPVQTDSAPSAVPPEERQVMVQRPAETGPLEVTPVEDAAVDDSPAATPPTPEPEPEAAPLAPAKSELQPAVVSREEPPQESTPKPVSQPVARERVAKAETITPPPPKPEPAPEESTIDIPNLRSAPPVREDRVFAMPRERETATVEPERPVEKPWNIQPIFSPRDQAEYGFDRFMLNMTKVADERNPFSFAQINRVKVFVGERVGSSSLRLAYVGMMEIGLEDIETGQRYYFRNR